MNDCHRNRKDLSLSAGRDLDETGEARIQAHCASCRPCRAQLAEIRQVIATARGVFPVSSGLSTQVVNRIAVDAATRQVSWRGRFALGPFALALPRPALAAAAALLVLLVSSQIIVPRGLPDQGGGEVVRIDMRLDGGEVRLAWNDGKGRAYTVRKSADPVGVAGLETYVVRGNAWADNRPDSSQIVYYRVE